jgi:hypothetical protein
MGGSPTLIHILIMKEEESKSKNINTRRKAQKNLPRRLKKAGRPNPVLAKIFTQIAWCFPVRIASFL